MDETPIAGLIVCGIPVLAVAVAIWVVVLATRQRELKAETKVLIEMLKQSNAAREQDSERMERLSETLSQVASTMKEMEQRVADMEKKLP